MNRQKENIGLLIGKVAIVCLFLFLFVFKPTDCPSRRSLSKIGTVEQIEVVNKLPLLNKLVFFQSFNNTFDQLYEVNNTALPSEPFFVPALYDACIIFRFNGCDKENYKIINSNNKICQLLKECVEQFNVIKPQIIDLDSFHILTSLNSEELALIS